MMKFFRKHMKYMLAVFMVLLIGIWVVGDPLYSFMARDRDPGKEILGEAFGQTVRLEDIRQASYLTETLEGMRINWSAVWRYPFLNLVPDLPEVMTPQVYQFLMTPPEAGDPIRQESLEVSEWFLLDLAARRSGIYVPREKVDLFKHSWGISPELINVIRSRRQITLESIDNALRSLIRIQEAASQACEAVLVSEADIQDFIRQTNEQIRVRIVSVEAGNFLDAVPAPTEEELQEHFEQYKNVTSRPGETLEFGYQLPEAVQVEYIQIDMASLVERQTVTEEEAFDYWKTHRHEFTRPPEPPSTAPATQPKPPEPYATFSEARPLVIEKLAEEKAQREALRIAREMITQLSRPWADAPTTQPGGFKEIPAEAPSDTVYPELIDRMETRFGRIFNYTRTHPLDGREIRDLPEIGRSTALAGTPQQIPFTQAAFFVGGLKAEPEDYPNHRRFFRNVYETCAEPFVDLEGNVYVFRTVAARPAQPPDNLDALRDQLIEDVRRQKAFIEARKEAEDLRAVAQNKGLKEAFEQDERLQEKLGETALVEPKPFTRKRLLSFRGGSQLVPGIIPDFGQDPDLVEACFRLVREASEQDGPHVSLYEQKSHRRWLLIQWLESLPVTREEYNQRREEAVDILRSERQMNVLRAWFDPEQILARAQWQARDRDAEREQAPPPGEDPDQAEQESPTEAEEQS